MTELYLCCPTYKRFDLLVSMIDSAESGSSKPDGYIILDNSAGQLVPYLEVHANYILQMPNVQILVSGYNMGVARGWNALMRATEQQHGTSPWCLIANDDVRFNHGTIRLFKEAIATVDTSKHAILCGDIDNVNAFSMFAVNPELLRNTVGWFDATIWPAYHEDGDMNYRSEMRGMSLYRINMATAVHNEGGSATLKSYNAQEEEIHHHQFRRNQTYYHAKWGGLPGEEKYTVPFNNKDLMSIMQQIHAAYGF